MIDFELMIDFDTSSMQRCVLWLLRCHVLLYVDMFSYDYFTYSCINVHVYFLMQINKKLYLLTLFNSILSVKTLVIGLF